MLLRAGLQLSSRLQLAQKGLPADRGLLSATAPESERVERLALAPDDDVRDLGELGVSDLAPERLLALVHRGAEPVHAQVVGEGLRVRPTALRDREDAHLLRCEPKREVTAEVLDEDSHEPLERTEQRPVDDVRRVLAVVFAREGKPEAGRHLRVELNRPHLPGAAEDILHVQIDLRPVEGPIPRVYVVVDPLPFERAREGFFGEIPLRVLAQLVLWPRRELEASFHAEKVVEVSGVVEAAEHLVLDLVTRAEDVGVVLGPVPGTKEAVERSARLVPVQRRGLCVADGQITVAADLAPEEKHVAGAIHRLQAVGPVLLLDQEHVVAVVLPMARDLPELDVVEKRGLDLLVTTVGVLALPKRLERIPDDHPAGMPDRRAR